MTRDEARALDAADPLAFARARFRLPEGVIYLDGNSLGALPTATPERLAEVAERQWGEDLIGSWNAHGWIDWPKQVAARLAPIVGADADELVVADSTSVCLFKALGAAVRARPERNTILTEAGNFPTDLYVAQSVADLFGAHLRVVERGQLLEELGPDTAVLFLTHVDYRSAERHDLAALSSAAREAGAVSVWDLSHSAGALALNLSASGAELAVGCGYKYLNGGPGAPAFIFARRDLQDGLDPPLPGWMGHAEPFAFSPEHKAASGMAKFLTGTPSILALAALEGGLRTFEGVRVSDVEAKARALTGFFIEAVERRCPQVTLASPRDPALRGTHVSFAHPDGYAIMQALIARGVVGDFRAPDLLRFGFAALYNRFEEAWLAAEALGEVLDSGCFRDPQFSRRARVT